MRPQVGQLINNKYRLAKLIGDGGMGSVFEAQHEVLGNTVALKFLHPELARRQGLVQRFLQEARVSAKIASPHVVKVTDVEQTPTGLPFMVMEFLKGKSLQSLYEDNYRAGKRLTYEEALKYSVQILDGLEAAHEEGVVHRDLKPDNVMIVSTKRHAEIVKLLDFGIAKLKINGELYKGLTRPGVIMGTPEYMAPEQVFSADAVDGRADIFSCGVMFFEMLAGRRPVGGDEAHQIAAAYLSGNIAKMADLAPQVPKALADVLHRAMAADPKDRFETVAEFRSAMDPFCQEVSRPGYTTTPPPAATPASEILSGERPVVAVREVSQPELSPEAHSLASGKVDIGAAPKSPDGWAVDGANARPSVDGVNSRPSVDGALTDKMSQPWRGDDDIAAISARLKAAHGVIARPSVDVGKEVFASTVEAQPLQGSTEPQPASAVASPRRPGGTDVGAGVLPATASYDSHPRAHLSPSPAYPTPAHHVRPVRRKKSGLGFGSILAIGVLVASAVVGGVYGFEQLDKSNKKDDGKTVALPTKSATTQPVVKDAIATTAPRPPEPYIPPPPPPQTAPKPTVAGPRPTGPRPSASTTTPPILPLPTVIIPSTWPPFELPGMGPGTSTSKQPPPPPPGQKDNPRPGRPKLEPIPQGEIQQPLRPPGDAQPKRPPREERADTRDGEPTIGRPVKRGTKASSTDRPAARRIIPKLSTDNPRLKNR